MKKQTLFIFLPVILWCIIGCSKKDNTDPIDEDPTDTEDPVGTVYLDQKFDLMVWGGDYIKQELGIIGGFVNDENGKRIIDTSVPTGPTATANTNGSSDLFDVMAPAYRGLRGVADWDGWKVYERPGYVLIGTSTTTDGFISTPVLSKINEDAVKLNVSIDLAIWADNSELILVEVIGGGTASVTGLTVPHSDRWGTYEFFVEGATKNTRILLKSVPERGKGRFFVDNVLIKKAE